MPFRNENILLGLREDAPFQQGLSNADPGDVAELKARLPWPQEPEASWLYFECTVGVMLDSGIVVHNRLPQLDFTPDTLSSALFADPNLKNIYGPGVNLSSRDQYEDIVQRMGHSRYWFRMWGQGLRAGAQIPIPSIKQIGGVPAIPYDKNPQSAFNRIFPGGNYSGVIIWHAAWSLWYTTAIPPRQSIDIPANDPATSIDKNSQLTDKNGFQAPFSQPDDEQVLTATLTTKRLPRRRR